MIAYTAWTAHFASMQSERGRPPVIIARPGFGRLAAAVVLLLACAGRGSAQSLILKSDETRLIEDFNWLPYAFFSQSYGLGFGAGASYGGWPDEESGILGAATVGTKGSYNFILTFDDLRVPGTRRLYVEPLVMLARYQDQFLYVGRNNQGFENQRAGAQDSDPDNYIEATQWDNRAEVELRYLLPLGHGADDAAIVNRYVIKDGFLTSGASGGEAWNPFASGRTHLALTPQWREQTLKNDDLDVPLRTMNMEAAVVYDNFDFPFNPTRGSFQRVAYKKDFDPHEQLGGWERWTAEWSKVVDLGRTDRLMQRVLAFNFWTSYVPTWETEAVDGREVVTRRPPHYDSPTLGGFDRMRAYEDNRFHDKAAIYYSIELRVIPEWQPLRRSELLEFADISFWQWVPFVEVGQVSPDWSLDDLHSDLRVDGGISLRGMLHKAVCRLDFAVGEEGMRVTAMYGHPF